MKKVLYVGGFEMPDKNAAAQRVLSMGKALRLGGYEVKFYGVTQDNDFSGSVNGFEYEAYPYPKSTKRWIAFATGANIISYLKKENPDYVFTYNYPALAQYKLIWYCKRHNIKVVGDITEWYKAHTFAKRVDTYLRMHYSNKGLDGIITISKYLSDYYSRQYQVQLPPFVDKSEDKWSLDVVKPTDDKIHLVYIGTGSVKDRLDKIVKGVSSIGSERYLLEIIGINEQQFQEIYGENQQVPADRVTFLGRLPHHEAVKHLTEADFQIFFRDSVRVNNAGFPTKFVESMSAGVPVITNRVSNIADYIENGKNSFMIEKPNEEQICFILEKIAILKREDINGIKANLKVNQFDYHNYVDVIVDFMTKL